MLRRCSHLLRVDSANEVYVRAMQERLREGKLGAKKEFLREVVKEVRVRDKTIQITYKLPLVRRTSPAEGKTSLKGEFCTLCNLVEAASQCKELLRTFSFRLS